MSRSQKSRDCLRSIDLTAKERGWEAERERKREPEQAKDRKIEGDGEK